MHRVNAFVPVTAKLMAYREVTHSVNGVFTYGRTILVPCANGLAKLMPNPYTPGTMCATVKLGNAYVSVVVDPTTGMVRK